MCGRYTLTKEERRLQERYGIIEHEPFQPRFNICPTQDAPVLLIDENPKIKSLRWGLIPFWAKDAKIGNSLINARCETIHEKPPYRAAFKKRRCLIPADGFYEWMKVPGGKQPMHIRLKNGEPFAFAGVWEFWKNAEEKPLLTFSIVTTEPNELLAQVHNRMPVIVAQNDYDQWLDPKLTAREQLESLFRPYPAEAMEFYPISTMVNNPRIEHPKCIERIEARQ